MKNILNRLSAREKGILYVLVFDLLLAINGTLTKTLSPGIQSSAIVLIRLSLSILVFVVISFFGFPLFKEMRCLSKKLIIKMVLLGILSSGLGFILYTIGIRDAGLGIGSLLGGQETLFGVVFGALILREKMNKKQILFMFGVLCGSVLLLSPKIVTTDINIQVVSGSIFAIGGAIALGLGNVIAKTFLTKEITPQTVSFFRSIGGIVFILVFMMFSGFNLAQAIPGIQTTDWVKFIYIGGFFSGLGLMVQFMGIKRLKMNEFSMLYALSSAMALIIAIVFLGESFLPVQIVGIVAMIGCNVLFVRERS